MLVKFSAKIESFLCNFGFLQTCNFDILENIYSEKFVIFAGSVKTAVASTPLSICTHINFFHSFKIFFMYKSGKVVSVLGVEKKYVPGEGHLSEQETWC